MGAFMIDPAIQRVIDADNAYRQLKRDVEREVRQEVRARVQEAFDRRSVAAFYARNQGLSVTRIAHEGLATKNRATADTAIARGGELVGIATPAALRDVGCGEFEWVDDTTVRFTPTAETIAPTLAALDLAAGEYHADFQVAEGRVIPITPGYQPGVGTNPVVRLVAGEDRTTRNRMADWAAKRP